MIGVNQLAIGVVWGAVLILVGLAPGLFPALVTGVHNFSNAVAGRRAGVVEVRQPRWLASLGFGLIVFSMVAYKL